MTSVEILDQRLIIHRSGSTDVYDPRSGFDQSLFLTVKQVFCFRSQGRGHQNKISLGQHLHQCFRSQHLVEALYRLTVSADTNDFHSQPRTLLSGSTTDVSNPDHYQSFFGNRTGVQRFPICATLVFGNRGNPVVEHQHRHQAELPSFRCVNSPVVDHFYTFRNPVHRAEMLDSCANNMNQFQLWRDFGEVCGR